MRGIPTNYSYTNANSLEQVLGALSTPTPPTLFAGGTDLMVVYESGRLPAGNYLSIWGLTELQKISADATHVDIGALCTYTQIQQHPVLNAEFPNLCAAARETGGPATQNRGTLGGNIINASPAADSPPALIAYNAEIELRSQSGARWLNYRDFHTAYKKMQRRPDELLTRIRLPRMSSDTGAGAVHYFRKVGTRNAQAISKVVMAAHSLRQGDRFVSLRLGLGSVAPTVCAPHATEAMLLNSKLDHKLIDAACQQLAREISPIDDIRSQADYRRKVAQNLLRDFLTQQL